VIADHDPGDEDDSGVVPGRVQDCDCTEMYMGDVRVPLPCFQHADPAPFITEAEVRAALAAGALESAAYRRVMWRRWRR